MKNNKIIISILGTMLCAIGVWGWVESLSKEKEIEELSSRIDNYYVVRDKALSDSAKYWHNMSDSFKTLAMESVNRANDLQKKDSLRHIKSIKKIHEVRNYDYNQSAHLSDSLLRAAGVK